MPESEPWRARRKMSAVTETAAFQHELLLHDGPDEFLAAAVPYLRAALEAEEPALVAVGPERTAALRGELGADAERIGFAEMRSLGRNPARIIPLWRDFVDGHAAGGRTPRGIGEPIWAGRTEHELDECGRHECLLNVAFDGAPGWSLLCPYDTSTLPDEVLEGALRCHPFSSADGGAEPNVAWVHDAAGHFAGVLPVRPPEAAVLEFGRDGLGRVRQLVGSCAEGAGLAPEAVSDLVTAASELAANSVAHGGGKGTAWVWADAADVVVEVADAGLIAEPLAGRRRPQVAQHGGRGLWIANLLCDLVQVRSGDEGTVVRLRMSLTR